MGGKLAFYPSLNRLYSPVFLPHQPWLWEIPNWQYAAGSAPLAMPQLPIDSPLRRLSTTMSPAVHGRTSCGHSCAAAVVLATVVSQRIDYHWPWVPPLPGSLPAPPQSFFWPSPFKANSSHPELQSLVPVPPLWQSSPILPIRILDRPNWPLTTVIAAGARQFSGRIQPVVVTVATTNNPETFTIMRATDPNHRLALGGCRSPELPHYRRATFWPSLPPPPATVCCHCIRCDYCPATKLFRLSLYSAVPRRSSSGYFSAVKPKFLTWHGLGHGSTHLPTHWQPRPSWFHLNSTFFFLRFRPFLNRSRYIFCYLINMDMNIT